MMGSSHRFKPPQLTGHERGEILHGGVGGGGEGGERLKLEGEISSSWTVC